MFDFSMLGMCLHAAASGAGAAATLLHTMIGNSDSPAGSVGGFSNASYIVAADLHKLLAESGSESAALLVPGRHITADTAVDSSVFDPLAACCSPFLSESSIYACRHPAGSHVPLACQQQHQQQLQAVKGSRVEDRRSFLM
jgi:hypothetical protein